MRRIDADELMKAMYHRAFETDGDTMWQSGCWVRYRAIEQVVKEQPIIEPKKGRWIKGGEQPYFRKHYEIVVCSKCNTRGDHRWNYCPNCGADMREGECG